MLEIVRTLLARGHLIKVYSFTLDRSVASAEGLDWVKLRPMPGPQLLVDLGMYRSATRAISRDRHDVVCLLGPCASSSGKSIYCAAFSQVGWNRVWKAAGIHPDLYRRTHGWISGVFEKRQLKRASGLISMSRRTADELTSLDGAPEIVEIAPGGVDIEMFPSVSSTQRDEARMSYSIPDGCFAVGLIGEFATPRKGLDVLAEAVAMRTSGDERLFVKGSGPVEKTEMRLRRAGTANDVVFADPGPINEFLAAMDVIAIPSLYEPFSLVALEAASSRLPIIISELAGAAPYLVDVGAAIAVDPSDASSIRQALDAVKNDDGYRSRLGAAARRVAEGMTWDQVSGHGASAIEEMART